MMEDVIPRNYEEWKHCITVECGIPLSIEFVEERITALQDIRDFKTKQFLDLYGERYLNQVLVWFSQAKTALQTNS